MIEALLLITGYFGGYVLYRVYRYIGFKINNF